MLTWLTNHSLALHITADKMKANNKEMFPFSSSGMIVVAPGKICLKVQQTAGEECESVE